MGEVDYCRQCFGRNGSHESWCPSSWMFRAGQ